MRRIYLFLIILIVSLASLTFLVVLGINVLAAAQQSPYSWMSGMWGSGMDGMMGGTSQFSALPFFGIAFIVLVGVSVIGFIGIAYYVALPELNTGVRQAASGVAVNSNLKIQPNKACAPLESVSKTLSDDERKVVDVLEAHDGQYLQKYVRKEAELSRLQTHRIVARLSARGIVTLAKTGNTNQVMLADWLRE
ncbi:TPA: hypothetical protein HA273_00015 [Candidatus Bathyarchaeota archaeon]|nr:hypothetical protein [Candidatus Bathyarchaeota archaeon]